MPAPPCAARGWRRIADRPAVAALSVAGWSAVAVLGRGLCFPAISPSLLPVRGCDPIAAPAFGRRTPAGCCRSTTTGGPGHSACCGWCPMRRSWYWARSRPRLRGPNGRSLDAGGVRRTKAEDPRRLITPRSASPARRTCALGPVTPRQPPLASRREGRSGQPGVSGRQPGDAASAPPAAPSARIPPACQPAGPWRHVAPCLKPCSWRGRVRW